MAAKAENGVYEGLYEGIEAWQMRFKCYCFLQEATRKREVWTSNSEEIPSDFDPATGWGHMA
eukprot:scaffold99505_cov20-Tisochrysis_lutea.AAC.1